MPPHISYVSPGRMTSIFLPANPTSAIVTNTYDSLGRVQTQADAYSNTWSYYFAGSRSEEVNPNGNSKIYYNNRVGGVLSLTNEVGQTWANTFDGLNRLITTIAPEGNSIILAYNLLNLIVQTQAIAKPGSGISSVSENFTYDPTWNKVKTSVDVLTNTTTFNYDSATGNLLNFQPPVVGGMSPQTTFTYNGRGQVLTVTDASSIVTQVNYDTTTEKLTSIVHDYGSGRLNLTTSLGYDTVGNLESVQDANGNIATVISDAQRRPVQTVTAAPFNYVSNILYDANGNKIQATRQTNFPDSPWQTSSATYTIDNMVATTVDPRGATSFIMFNVMRQIGTTVDPSGRVVTMNYDSANRLYQIKDPSSTIAQTALYSANGFLVSVSDSNSNTTQYTRDGFDRLDKTIYPDSSYERITSYDGNGNALTIQLRSGNTITLTYNSHDRPTTKTPTGQATVSFGYDIADNLISVSVPTISGDPSTGNFQKFYDTANRFYKEQYPDGTTVVHQLDSNGNVTQTIYPDGYYINRVFDQLNRLTDIKLNGASTSALNFQYDALSRRTVLSYENGTQTYYFYDTFNRLTSLSHNYIGGNVAFNYELDAVGQTVNASSTDPAFTWHPPTVGTNAYGTANGINQYPTVGGVTYSYNTNGCLTSDGIWTYGFNTENMLVSASKAGISAAYTYDPLMRQIEKNVNSVKTQYYYAGFQRLADYDGSGTLLSRYVYGIGLDEVFIQISGSGVKTYYHHNHQGSIVAATTSSGSIANKYTYGPFGESSSLSSTMHAFTGQRFDLETGLYYYKARYYSPALGRFLQPDSIGYGDGLNVYAYAQNDPIGFTDSTGMAADGGEQTKPLFGPITQDGMYLSGFYLKFQGNPGAGGSLEHIIYKHYEYSPYQLANPNNKSSIFYSFFLKQTPSTLFNLYTKFLKNAKLAPVILAATVILGAVTGATIGALLDIALIILLTDVTLAFGKTVPGVPGASNSAKVLNTTVALAIINQVFDVNIAAVGYDRKESHEANQIIVYYNSAGVIQTAYPAYSAPPLRGGSGGALASG